MIQHVPSTFQLLPMPRIEVFTGLIKFHESLPKSIEKQKYKEASLSSFFGFLSVKKEMTRRQLPIFY